MIEIPLEPRLTPQANAEVYFKKARKAQRRAALVENRKKAAKLKIKELRALLREVGEPDISEDRLKQLTPTVIRVTATEKEKKAREDERALRLGIKPRRYTVTDGWTVLVGHSAKENDILTHRYAAPGDLWFHARQAQGSHVVLRKQRKKAQVSKQAVLEAAAIAAYHSKARTSKHVPVSYTEKRYIKRVRKGPPGLCVMLREKVVFVDPTLPT
jgi:predicted ribosome quality control (RQC) complex YloA/Tae2 family protein